MFILKNKKLAFMKNIFSESTEEKTFLDELKWSESIKIKEDPHPLTKT